MGWANPYGVAKRIIDERFPDFGSDITEVAGQTWERTVGDAFFEYDSPSAWLRSIDSLLDYLEIETVDELRECEDDDEETQTWKKALELIESGFRVYLSRMPHDGEGGSRIAHEAYLARKMLHIEDEDFVLYFQGGLNED
jgi:hypothetical protein